MIQAIFRFLINLLATVIQLVVWPLNAIFSATMPNIASKITEVGTSIGDLFAGMNWALGLIPTPLLQTLTFILGIEIAKHTIFANSYMITKVWLVLQKIKFW